MAESVTVEQLSMVGLPRQSSIVGGRTAGEVALACFASSGLSLEQWNALKERERAELFRSYT